MKSDSKKKKSYLFIFSHSSPGSPKLDKKDYVEDQTTINIWHLKNTDTTFYNHCIHLSLSFQEQSDLSSKTST